MMPLSTSTFHLRFFGHFIRFSSLVKITHTIFAFPFALIGFFLGWKTLATSFSWSSLAWVSLCLFFARNAAMAFNRWADAHIDAKNDRTRNREIPKGLLSKKSVLLFTLFNSICFITTTYFINALCFVLSPLALFIILGYSYTKRFTALCHFVLGLGLSLAPLGAFLAVDPEFYGYMICLSGGVLCWVSGFDILYALQDIHFDTREGLFSIPVYLGAYRARMLSKILHLCSLILLGIFGKLAGLHLYFWGGYVLFGILLFYQHYLTRGGKLNKINIAFFTNNGIASVLFCIATLYDIYLYK